MPSIRQKWTLLIRDYYIIVIMNDGGMGYVGGGCLISVFGWGTGGGYYFLVCFLCLFLFVLLSFGLSCPASFLSE